jgi:hypothetical protein
MKDEFLRDNLLVYIEREMTESFDSDLILNNFVFSKTAYNVILSTLYFAFSFTFVLVHTW